MTTIHNPILPGFNADPSICRVGDDFYIATSTFEWFPGVQIHHSKDLVHWHLLTRPLTRKSQLDMRGNPDSGGVWAPCLSHADGKFWLVYSDVKRIDGNYKDAHNYIVTASDIMGSWSDPIYVNSSGFDPSLFHDDDGRKYFVNMVWNPRHDPSAGERHPDNRPGSGYFGGILLQEFDAVAGKLKGPVHNIYRGSPRGLVEGPHLFKRNGYYYLTTAEGGTGYEHAVTYARAKNLLGPYETHPQHHLLTAQDAPEGQLQRSGHGQIVFLKDGSAYHTHLTCRPLPGTRRSVLGRETGIQKVVFGADGWPRLAQGGLHPAYEVEAPNLPPHPFAAEPARHDFNETALPASFQWLRTPEPARLFSLTARPGKLRLYGRESVGSWFEQSLVALRQTSIKYRAETKLDFTPETFQQMAGLIAYYNRHQFHYLLVTADDERKRKLVIQSCPGLWPDGNLVFPLGAGIDLPMAGSIWLRVDVDQAALQFSYSVDGAIWKNAGPVLDASILSDEGGRGEHADFTGAFVGMAAQDLTGQALAADFDYFEYHNLR